MPRITSSQNIQRRFSLYRTVTMLQVKFANELWLKTHKCPHVRDNYVPKKIFFEGVLQSIRHCRRAYWRSQKPAVLEELSYHDILFTTLQAAANARDQPEVYSNKLHRSTNLQSNSPWKTINVIRSPSNMSPQYSYILKRVEVAAVNNANIASLVNSTAKVDSTVSKEDLDKVPELRLCFKQFQRPSSCPLIPLQLHAKVVQNRMDNLKTIPRQELSFYKQKYEH